MVLDCLLSLFYWKSSRCGVWLRICEYSVVMVFLPAELFRTTSATTQLLKSSHTAPLLCPSEGRFGTAVQFCMSMAALWAQAFLPSHSGSEVQRSFLERSCHLRTKWLWLGAFHSAVFKGEMVEEAVYFCVSRSQVKGGHSSLALLISVTFKVSICANEVYSPVLSARVFVYCLKNTVTLLFLFLNTETMMKRLETPVTDSALERRLSTETSQWSLFSSSWWISLLRSFISVPFLKEY